MRNCFNLSGTQDGQAIRYGKPFAIYMLDAVNLRKINDVRTVMANADAAMYSSKKSGKNRSTLYLADRDRDDSAPCQA